jgi:hypothetical protein
VGGVCRGVRVDSSAGLTGVGKRVQQYQYAMCCGLVLDLNEQVHAAVLICAVAVLATVPRA